MHTKAPRVTECVLSPRFYQLHSPLSNEALNATAIIGICIKNQANHIKPALASAMAQSIVQQGDGAVLILNDNSSDEWLAGIDEWLDDPRLIIVHALCGTAARARNALLDWVDAELPTATWVARLDADDKFARTNSVQEMLRETSGEPPLYLLGSNHLEEKGEILPDSNIADPSVLQNREPLVRFIDDFCSGRSRQELPSCNLILRTHSGIRYPDVKSAEDHWLVAELLMLKPEQGFVIPHPIYSVYSLDGGLTEQNRKSSQWSQQRHKLAAATKLWLQALNNPVKLLGVGQEGIVWQDQQVIWKRFYPHAMNDFEANRIQSLTTNTEGPLPSVSWNKSDDGTWCCQYPWFDSEPVPTFLPAETARQFLKRLHASGYVTSNIKRTNLRLTEGQLIYIDIGKDIVPLSPSRFLDAAARLYSITVLGQSDFELARRETTMRLHESLATLEGFNVFYRNLIEELFPHCIDVDESPILPLRDEPQVTLLIKSCPQDAGLLQDQVEHIVSQLSYPAAFAKKVLLIDPYTGPFLRQYAKGDLEQAQKIGLHLLAEEIIDDVWQAPADTDEIRDTYLRWFGRNDISSSHTSIFAPVFSQLWAFEQVNTPYVLQCDSDVLIGRRDLSHDYLADMIKALTKENVVCVGFNIPQPSTDLKPYHGNAGEFAPEVRCGLLHLPRLRALCPLHNTVDHDRFNLMWHRSVQQTTHPHCRSVRGGDHRSFYVHPMNTEKDKPGFPVWRDLISQGMEPDQQKGKWDLFPDTQWQYPIRDEPLIFLLKGRDTSIGKLRRSLASLKMQREQRFGLIVIDDGGSFANNWHLPLLLGTMKSRTTLIRRRERFGYIRNFKAAIGEICSNPESLIVTLDLDDALMSSDVVAKLYEAINSGADLINGGMFRPDKPFHLYIPNYQNPRHQGGANVWAHLRGFRKKLFDQLPSHYLEYQGDWVKDVTDYALMLPLSEMAKSPMFIDDLFCYYHQRYPYSKAKKSSQHAILSHLFSLPGAESTNAVVPALNATEGD
ncbi:glycosyltransferase family A protein [Neptuniibacter halophilus]|uniref:glycosyltransferase family A protein n=1 Tax=Neptuniibacter halophilus TaxID=651666 RepID=UPI00257395C9|nr:glycosyltransferase family 2 protein [Neptuniibacter halophilus]